MMNFVLVYYKESNRYSKLEVGEQRSMRKKKVNKIGQKILSEKHSKKIKGFRI